MEIVGNQKAYILPKIDIEPINPILQYGSEPTIIYYLD